MAKTEDGGTRQPAKPADRIRRTPKAESASRGLTAVPHSRG